MLRPAFGRCKDTCTTYSSCRLEARSSIHSGATVGFIDPYIETFVEVLAQAETCPTHLQGLLPVAKLDGLWDRVRSELCLKSRHLM
jgi:hypothetical protein